jgi:hypothetical protein
MRADESKVRAGRNPADRHGRLRRRRRAAGAAPTYAYRNSRSMSAAAAATGIASPSAEPAA